MIALSMLPNVAKRSDWRYGSPVVTVLATGRRGPNSKLAHKRPKTIAGAFFVPAMPLYGGRAWDTFGCAGCQLARSANPRTAATPNRVAAIRGSSITQVGASPLNTRNPSTHASAWKARALSALRSNSSLSVRLSRYNAAMARARSLEAQEVQHDH
ncbi:hypothetical protein [Pseudomonas panipatensis]|uniref:hypothetical protein n=1 Tax=Pseudomonas panipatensis TaxID=428992 RepID=UPI0035B3D35E